MIKPRSRLFHGHDWVYVSEVQKAFGAPVDGAIVSLKDGADRMLGSAIYNSKSQIVARRFSRQRQDLDHDFFVRRFRLALEYRERHGLIAKERAWEGEAPTEPSASIGAVRQEPRPPNAGRLVWSESDGIPGVIVDRYGEHLVLQTLTLAMDQRKDVIVAALKEVFAPRSIVERNDAPIRKAEGLELQTGVLHGEAPEPFAIEIGGLQYVIDLMRGQKTGFYLDQIPNYAGVAKYAAGRRVLDCFANQGAFALSCAKAGAKQVTAIEISADCVGQIKENASRNAVAVEAVAANVFDTFKDLERQGARYDLVILDPPSFTKSKGKLHEAMRGYKEIHLRALKLLEPSGLLATFCCSHHVDRSTFIETINEAAVDAKKTLRQIGTFGQALDHPIISTIPETEYLKGFLFELVPGR